MNASRILKSRLPLTLATLALSLSLGACASMSHREVSTAVGTAVGGVVGAAATGGSTVGTVGGAVAGGMIGNELSKRRR